ncbi:CPBP family intramembrane glutamic endopeptidase [Deinococcus sp.]|uniref:CPBP family intramembrane glutamic endopeptidase n=1 Tax=Deinococcus sp. TaxID=47478 RepID=UPI003B59B4B2
MSDLPPLKTSPTAAEVFASPDSLPTDVPPVSLTRPPISPAEGGWAVIIVLGMQNLVAGVGVTLGLGLGLSLLLAFASTVLVFGLTMRRTALALFQDSRWLTRPNIGVALGGLALGLVASRGLLIFVLSLWPGGADSVPQFLSKGSDAWVLLLAAGLLIPLAEEMAFRGVLMRGLEWARGPLLAAIVSSLLFGLAHGSPAQVIAILPLGWLLARSVQHSGSLWTSVLIHMLNNTLAVGLGMALQGRDLSEFGGDLTGKIPLELGLAGLLIGAAALAVGTLWLRPRSAPVPVANVPIFTVSTVLLGVLILIVVGISAASLLLPPGTIPGV